MAKKGQAYFKAKNGRFYKKIVVDGKTRCRFVSNAEATANAPPKKKRRRNPKQKPQEAIPTDT